MDEREASNVTAGPEVGAGADIVSGATLFTAKK
jgi:hypothetical protein